MNLLELFQKASARPELQREADEEFWQAIEAGGFRRWRKGDPVLRAGRRLLIGLASYSRQDVELAQELIDRRLREQTPVIELFNVLDVQDMNDFEQYIPGIGNVYQTPVVGSWDDGVLVRKAQGVAAQQAIHELIP
jgi:hypothetical protein